MSEKSPQPWYQAALGALGILPGPWLFSRAGIDISTAPYFPKLAIVCFYCIGSTLVTRVLLNKIMSLRKKQG
jgi:hypothetical protein